MVYVIVGLSVFFIAIGFIVTEHNAGYLLAGYNTKSKKEQEQFNLKQFLPYFRRFHVFLGLSLLVLGMLGIYLWGTNGGGLVISIYPIVAYMYFAWRSQRFESSNSQVWNKAMIYILGGTLVFIMGLLYLGYKEDRMIVEDSSLKVVGTYGITVPLNQVASTALVRELPEIRLRVNGMSMGDIRKGFFKTASGETVRLILNDAEAPYIFIKTNDGKKIYYSSRSQSNEQIYQELQQALP